MASLKSRLLLGFMLNTAFLSMWISNLAACTLMIPIINASLDQLRQKNPILSYEQPNEQIGNSIYINHYHNLQLLYQFP